MKFLKKIKDFINPKNLAITLLVITCLILVVGSVKSCVDAKNQRDAMQSELTELKRMTDQVVRSKTQYVTKEDLDKFGKDLGLNLDEIKKDMATNDAKMAAISKALVVSLGRRQTGVPSSWTRPTNNTTTPVAVCPDGSEQTCEDEFGYWAKAQGLNLTEPFPNVEVPIGSVTFEAWKKDPWSIDVKPREYHVTTVLGRDKSGRHYTYNKFEVGVDGKKYPVEINDSVLKEILPEASFSWWNPRFGIGLHGGVGFNTTPSPDRDTVSAAFGPTISFSPFSYGELEVKPDWIFARIGVGVDAVHGTATFSLAPAMWNLGSEVEFIQNTYLGPVITVDHQSRVGVGIGITTDF